MARGPPVLKDFTTVYIVFTLVYTVTGRLAPRFAFSIKASKGRLKSPLKIKFTKMKRPTKLFAGLLALIVAVICCYGQFVYGKSMPATQCSEKGCDEKPPTENSYSYPIMFDGQILDYADFTMKSHGQLSIVRGTPGAANAVKMPFYIFLKRKNDIVRADNVNFLWPANNSIEISRILSFSKAGDVLIIVPLAKPDGKTTIILNQGGC